jgi:hypothetical protein
MGPKIPCPSVALVVAAIVDSCRAVWRGHSGPERPGAMSGEDAFDAFGASGGRRSAGSARGSKTKGKQKRRAQQARL